MLMTKYMKSAHEQVKLVTQVALQQLSPYVTFITITTTTTTTFTTTITTTTTTTTFTTTITTTTTTLITRMPVHVSHRRPKRAKEPDRDDVPRGPGMIHP
jgi:hypothetical protein